MAQFKIALLDGESALDIEWQEARLPSASPGARHIARIHALLARRGRFWPARWPCSKHCSAASMLQLNNPRTERLHIAIGRSLVAISGRSVAMFERGVRVKFAKLFERVTAVAQCLGDARPYVSSNCSGYIRLVLGPRPAKVHLREKYKDNYEHARATEPWLLAASLENHAAQTIVQLYAQRMKIEEAFRDTKCPRFGWALKYSGSKRLLRFDALLLIAAFAIAAVLLIGAAAVQPGIEKNQARECGPFPKTNSAALLQPKRPASTSARFVLHRVRLEWTSIRLAAMTLVGITQSGLSSQHIGPIQNRASSTRARNARPIACEIASLR